MNDHSAIRKRLLRYVPPVLVASVLFNATKFLEAELVVDDQGTHMYVRATQMRTDPIFSTITRWMRLVLLGLAPFLALSFLNWKIFMDVRARKRRRLRMTALSTSPVSKEAVKELSTICHVAKQHRGEVVVASHQEVSECLELHELNAGDSDDVHRIDNESSEANESVDHIHLQPLGHKTSRTSRTSRPKANSLSVVSEHEEEKMASSNSNNRSPCSVSLRRVREIRWPRMGSKRRMTATRNEKRRMLEDNLAVVFIGFILVFLACHTLRVLLDIHELATVNEAQKCMSNGHRGFPPWTLFTIHVSHVMLVVNSATNILVYCGLSSRFRDEFVKIVPQCRAVDNK